MMTDNPVPSCEPLPQPPAYQVSVPPDPPLALSVTGSPAQGGLGFTETEGGGASDVRGVNVTEAQDEVPQNPSLRT